MDSLFIGFLLEEYATCQSRKLNFGWDSKNIVISASEHHHLCSMVVTRFPKNKITFVFLNNVFFVLIRGPF